MAALRALIDRERCAAEERVHLVGTELAKARNEVVGLTSALFHACSDLPYLFPKGEE